MSIRITAKKDGFRRCGMAHSTRTTIHPDSRFSKKELAVLQADPMLVVDIIEDQAAVEANLNAKDTIKLVKEASDLESLATLAEGEERKSVLEAIDARRQELTKE